VKKHMALTLVVVGIVAVLGLYFVAFTMRWQEKALVLTFGKISREVDTAGLNWIWPWQKVVRFDGRIRTYRPNAIKIQTADKQTIIVEVYANWRIDNARVFYERFRSGATLGEEDVVAQAEATIRGWIGEAMNVFAEYDLSQLITLNAQEFKLAAVEGAHSAEADGPDGMLQRIQAQASVEGGYGIEVLDLGICNLGVPDTVSQAVFARMNTDREAEATRLFAQGKSKATSIVGRAEAERTRILARAAAAAKKIEAEGDAAAAQYYEVFLAEPDLANFLRRLDTLRRTLNKRTTLVLDCEAPPYKLLTTGPVIVSEKQAGPTNK